LTLMAGRSPKITRPSRYLDGAHERTGWDSMATAQEREAQDRKRGKRAGAAVKARAAA
jgi:CDGSH-type Zn-finger protein